MEAIFGVQNHLDLAQECARAVLIFFYGLVMLRLSGRRTFARFSAMDMVISFIVGSALSRTLTGGAPLAGTLAAVAVLVALHMLLGFLVARSDGLSRIVEGGDVLLAQDGRLNAKTCLWHMISRSDIAETLRGEGLGGPAALKQVKCLHLEPSGRITVVKQPRS